MLRAVAKEQAEEEAPLDGAGEEEDYMPFEASRSRATSPEAKSPWTNRCVALWWVMSMRHTSRSLQQRQTAPAAGA